MILTRMKKPPLLNGGSCCLRGSGGTLRVRRDFRIGRLSGECRSFQALVRHRHVGQSGALEGFPTARETAWGLHGIDWCVAARYCLGWRIGGSGRGGHWIA